MDQAKKSPPDGHTTRFYGPVTAVLITVGTYFASQLIVVLSIYLLPSLFGWEFEKLQRWLDTSAFAKFLAVLLLGAVTLYLIWLFMKMLRVTVRSIGLVRPYIKDIGYALVGYGVYLALFLVTSIIFKALVPGVDMNQEQQLGFSKNTTGMALVFVFASLVILPPITEEIVMRGFLYTGLRKRLPIVSSAIVTSIIFAAAHLQWGSDAPLLWAAALDTFVLSMVLVYLRETTGSLWSPILVHTIKNLVAFTMLFVFIL